MTWIAAALATITTAPPAEPSCVQLVHDTPDKVTAAAPCVPLKPTLAVCYLVYSDLAFEARMNPPGSTAPFWPFEKYSNFRKFTEADWNRRADAAARRALGAKAEMNIFKRRDMLKLWTEESGQTAVPRGPYRSEGIDPDGVVAPAFATLLSDCDASFGFSPAFVYRTGASVEKRDDARACAADILALGQRRPELQTALRGLMAAAVKNILRLDPSPPTQAELMAQLRGWAQGSASDPESDIIARVRNCADSFPEGPWSAALADL